MGEQPRTAASHDRVVRIREATDEDWASLYRIFTAITAPGRTFAYPQDATSDQARALWMGQGHVIVAVDQGQVLGTATMGANRPDAGLTSPREASWSPPASRVAASAGLSANT